MSDLRELVITRARLRRDVSAGALAPLLLPKDEPGRASAAHRLVWSLMSDAPDRTRDFLWREEQPGAFIILSHRRPCGHLDLFELESKPFAPVLAASQRLRFVLRANPTASHKAEADGPGTRGKRRDVVMHAIYGLPRDRRGEARPAAVRDAVTTWLQGQGERAGFALEGEPSASGYRQLRLAREGGRKMTIACVECEGLLTVIDPALFLDALATGFGRARAFGCGLMLIRRA